MTCAAALDLAACNIIISMTMQMRDVMHFEEEVWSLWGINGEGFFEPSKHGLNVQGWRSTACYRGYYGTYRIHHGSLQLLELQINLDENTAPLLNGRTPTKNSEEDISICGDLTYLDVELPVPFSGSLLLCCKWVRELPSPIGPELAWRFERIKELIFEDRKLIDSYDHSDAVAKIREEVAANNGEFAITVPMSKEESNNYARYKSLEAKINSNFKFDY